MSDSHAVIERKPIPPELDRWNWGAFLLNWIWGIGNNTYIALLTLIPLVGFVMPFVLGAKGSKWAWQNGRWDNVEHFKRVQRGWAKWGAIIWLGAVVLFASIFFGVFALLKHSEAYQLGVAKLQASPVAVAVLGTPITAGTPNGKVSVQAGGTGEAILNFPASGPKAAGTVVVEAVRKDGVWTITRLTLKPAGSDRAINLINAAKGNST
jgi:Cytochrome oxidase complex assembly protein 1/Protein of unknown function (DUF3176)